MRFLSVGVAVAVVVGLFTTMAFAEPPGATPLLQPLPSAPLVESYRAQTLAADGAALLTTVAAFGDPQNIGALAVGVYILGAPMVHLAHHRPGRAFGSFAMRIIPFGVALLVASSYKAGDWNGAGAILTSFVSSALLVSVLDTAVLAKGDEPPPPPRSWGPTLAPSHGGLTLGVGGSF